MNQCEIAGCDAEVVDGETCATHTANYAETSGYESEVCACGHDDVTHALRLVGGWQECLASLPNDQGEIAWECKCPKFVPMPSADEIRAAQAEARAAETLRRDFERDVYAESDRAEARKESEP